MTKTVENAIRQIKDFGIQCAMKDLTNSAPTVRALNVAIKALENWDAQYQAGYEDGEHDGYYVHDERKYGAHYIDI